MDRADKGHLEDAMACLAGLEYLCKLLLLRIGQAKVRGPNLNGLIKPMDEEVVEIMEGIRGAQRAHARIWERHFMK
jgi:hypothetical protein